MCSPSRWLLLCLRCLDDVPPSVSRSSGIVGEDLGASVDEIFKEFDDTPLSARPLRRCTRARLPDGREARPQDPATEHHRPNEPRPCGSSTASPDSSRRPNRASSSNRSQWSKTSPGHHEELELRPRGPPPEPLRANIGAFGDNEWITAPRGVSGRCVARGVIAMESMTAFRWTSSRSAAPRYRRRAGVAARLVKVWDGRRSCTAVPWRRARRQPLTLEVWPGPYLDFGIMGSSRSTHRDAVKDAQYTTMTTATTRASCGRGSGSGSRTGDEIGPVEEVAARIRCDGPDARHEAGRGQLSSMMKDQLDWPRSTAPYPTRARPRHQAVMYSSATPRAGPRLQHGPRPLSGEERVPGCGGRDRRPTRRHVSRISVAPACRLGSPRPRRWPAGTPCLEARRRPGSTRDLVAHDDEPWRSRVMASSRCALAGSSRHCSTLSVDDQGAGNDSVVAALLSGRCRQQGAAGHCLGGGGGPSRPGDGARLQISSTVLGMSESLPALCPGH